jgi:PAS domain S-box-containing protein
MDLDLERFNQVSPDEEPGMNLISADFDLIMVNRVNERLYGKPMVEMLGKKCYREFEKREEPCPHCPGRISLATGQSHEAETEGRRDDGTWFSARVRTHPVQGPGDKPTGFIEVVEDTTEEKRAEKLGRIDEDLQSVLATADSVQKALLHCLEAALRVEGIDAGCVFTVDWVKRETALVLQRNVSADFIAALEEAGLESAMSGELPSYLTRVLGAPRAGEVVPIDHRGQRIAMMVVGAYVYPSIPASLRAGLHSLGSTAGHAISRILAERSRGDAVADLEAFITVAPLAAWLVDPEGRLTMWNRAAERLLGWGSAEILGRRPPFLSQPAQWWSTESQAIVGREITLLAKDGCPVQVRLTAAPFRDLVGNASSMIVMAEDLSLAKRVACLERTSALLGSAIGGAASPAGGDGSQAGRREADNTRVLVVNVDPSRVTDLVGKLERSGWETVACLTMEEAVRAIADAQSSGAPFSAAVVELISPGAPTGLEIKACLRELGMDAPILVCSDADVLGYEFHGFAGVIKRPFTEQDLERAVNLAVTGTR